MQWYRFGQVRVAEIRLGRSTPAPGAHLPGLARFGSVRTRRVRADSWVVRLVLRKRGGTLPRQASKFSLGSTTTTEWQRHGRMPDGSPSSHAGGLELGDKVRVVDGDDAGASLRGRSPGAHGGSPCRPPTQIS